MEAELFGHRKGAFTGAVADRTGLFEQAEAGTLFLDEIGELPLQLQAKLLRVLQEKEFRRIGDDVDMKSDVRIIAASNRDLEEQVKEGSFREDLYYRLDVVQVRMPSLRERPEDIPLLAEHFYRKFAGKGDALNSIENEALKALINYPFPGNVRELENIVERCVVIGDRSITLDSLPFHVVNFQKSASIGKDFRIPEDGVNLEAYLDGIEKRYLLQALDQSGGVRKKAAQLLGLSFRSMRYRLAKFGMADDE
jgi:two-component system response regulator PilR (NtrC family)